MILRRLLTLTTNNQHICKTSLFNFSSTKPQQPTEQQIPQQQADQQIHAQPNTIQQSGQTQQNTNTETIQSRKGPRREEKFDNFLVYDYLVRSRPNLNMKDCANKIEGLTDITQITKIMSEFQNDIEEQRTLPIKDFEKKLNLSYQTLMKKAFYESQIDNQHLSKIGNETLNNLPLPKIKKLYLDGTYRSIQTPGFVSNIFKAVSTKGKESFLLNIVYEVIAGSTRVNQKVQDLNELQSYFNSVSFGTYTDVNPIKFFWAASKIKPQLQNKSSQLLLRQFNNGLNINNKNVSKQLKSLSYFFLSKQISSKVILKLLNSTSNLEEVVNTWVIIMLTMSRIKKILQSPKIPNNINFQDIYSLNQKVNHNREFIKNTFPKILSDFEKLNILEIYQKSLQKPQGNQLDIIRGDLEIDLELDLSSQKRIELSYEFNEDPVEFRTYLNNPIFSQADVNFVQKRFVERIAKRQYSAALEQYEVKIGQKLKNHDVINQYKFEAKNLGFSSSDSQALYVLRHIFRDSKDFIDTPKHILSEQKFNKTFFNTGFNRDQRKPATFRPKKNYIDQDAIDNERQHANEQILESRPNQTPSQKPRGLFQKKPIASFSTKKQIEDQSENMNNSQYENYLRTVKEVEESQKISTQQLSIKYDFSNCGTLEQVEKQFKTHLSEINQNNIKQLIQKYQNIPVVKNIKTLIKHFFLNVQINNQAPNGLLASFESSFGQIQKDYGKYLQGNAFLFQLPDFLYEELLNSQNKRQKFKKVVAHILLYSSNISDVLVRKICQTCENQKIGLTLLEIINLINAKRITISYESLKKIASSVQHFKGMESDLLQFLKNYAERAGLQLETKLFEPYIGNLTLSEKYQGLNSFLEILRQEIKSKQYKINPSKTPAENIEAQKIYKIKEAERTNSQLFEILRIISISFKPRTTVPSFVTEMMDLYFSKKTSPLNSKDYGVGLIIYSQSQEKFLDLLSRVKEEKNENNQFVLESVIRSLLLFGRNLKNQIEKILGATLFKKQFNLNEVQLNNLGFIFKELDIPGAYGEYLEYLLKKQPMITPEIKNLYYKILNNTTDDYSKNQISGLLDFLFNPSREKERVQYKQVKIQEERKSQLLNNMKNQDYSNKSQAKVTQIQASNSSAQAKGAGKEKKKSKKEDKTKKGTEQETAPVKVEQKETTEISKKQKTKKDLDAFFMAKINSSFSYDNNRKYIYNEKLSAYDKRKSSLRQFLGHMAPRLKQEQGGKDKTGKSKETKESGKKEVSGKKK